MQTELRTPDSTRPGAPANLTGRLGTGSIVFMVIAAAAPLTVIGGNVPLAIGSGPGAGAPVGFVIASVVLLLFAVGFVTMTPHVTEAGAFYSYATRGLGGRIGVGTAAVALVAYTAIQVGIYGYMGWAVDDVVHFFGGPHIPWWLSALAAVALVAFLGYRHIELSSKVLGVALVLEITVMLIVDVVIFIRGGAHGINVESFTPHAAFSGPLGVAVLFALTGFLGFESTAIFRDEARRPEKTIPRATYLAVIIIGVFYAISCWALVLGVGTGNAKAVAEKTLNGNGNMLMDTAQTYAGSGIRDIMQVLLLSSLFACVLSFHNVIARYTFTLAHKGLMPAKLGTVHPRHGSPSFSSLIQTVTALVLVGVCALIGLDPLVGVFGSMAGIATVGMVLLMLTTSIAVVVFFARNPGVSTAGLWKTRIAPVLASLGLLASLWLVFSNFTMVTSSGVGVSIVLGVIPFAAFAAGVIRGPKKEAATAERT